MQKDTNCVILAILATSLFQADSLSNLLAQFVEGLSVTVYGEMWMGTDTFLGIYFSFIIL